MQEVYLPELLQQAQTLSPDAYLAWCDTVQNVMGANRLFQGTGQPGIQVVQHQASYVEKGAMFPMVVIGKKTGFGLDRVRFGKGHVTGCYEPGAYVVGYDILGVRSDGTMWAIYFGFGVDNWYDYNPLLPAATAEAVFKRCDAIVTEQDRARKLKFKEWYQHELDEGALF